MQCDDTTCVLPEGVDLEVSGTVTATRGAFDSLEVAGRCPMGYEQDPSEAGFTLCRQEVAAGRFDEMVKVGPFWVDKYEMSVWANSDCTGAQFGDTANNWAIQGNGSDFAVNDVYGCSIANETPTRFVTWFQAAQSCLASGKYLCRNAEWQLAALGTPDPDTVAPIATDPVCNIWDGLLPRGAEWGVPNTITRTGSAEECISNAGANDMVGNLAEWVEEWGVSPYDSLANDYAAAFSWPPYDYGDDATWGINGRAYDGVEYVEGLPVAVIRGGDWADGSAAGVYAISYMNAPSTSEWRRGARCCRGY